MITLQKKRAVFLAIRPADQWDETRQAFSKIDVDLDCMEVLLYTSVPVNFPDSDSYDGLIVSSARSVLLNEQIRMKYRDLPLYVVGERTGKRLVTLGMGPVVACAPTGEALAEHLKKETGRRYLYLSGDKVAFDFSEYNLYIDRCITYKAVETESLGKNIIQKIKNPELKAVLFFSRETARIFTKQVSNPEFLGTLPLLSALCLSQSVLECVKELPWAQTRVAPTPDLAGMVVVSSCAF